MIHIYPSSSIAMLMRIRRVTCSSTTVQAVGLSIMNRRFASYAAVVVGAGPAGVAVVGNLLEKQITPIMWVDKSFSGGRINKLYRDVPSNTKVKRFVDYAEALDPFQKIIKGSTVPNALTTLKRLDQEHTCWVGNAADLCLMLTDGVVKSPNVYKNKGTVKSASWSTADGWSIKIKSKDASADANVTADRLILCTGSSPRPFTPLIRNGPPLEEIQLDQALNPASLTNVLPTEKSTTVALIGGSHSAIIVLRQLAALSNSTHPRLRIKWFIRHPLIYAQEMDGWILRDNTGLKGAAAAWARENLEDDRIGHSSETRHIEKVSIPKDEAEKNYQQHLPHCTHMIQAIGFVRDPIPFLTRNGKPVAPSFDHLTGGFEDEEKQKIHGLYGAGIAFPERVTDPYGNVEYAVGLWKFMTFLKKVMPQWV